jgi:peptide/nickel transport system permease protein
VKTVTASTDVALGAKTVAPAPGRSRIPLRRLWRFKWGVAAGAVMLLVVASAICAPWIAPYSPVTVDIQHRLGPPAWMEGGTRAHLLGTDQIGRDLLSRVIYGGRV